MDVTRRQLADFFSCSTRHVSELAERGIVIRTARGKFDFMQSAKRYIGHLREQAANRGGDDIGAAATQLKRSNAKLAELRYQKEAGELIEVRIVNAVWGPIMQGVRQFVLGIPGAFAFECPSLTPTDRRALERICNDGLTDCAMQRGFDFSGVPGMDVDSAPTAPDAVTAPDVEETS